MFLSDVRVSDNLYVIVTNVCNRDCWFCINKTKTREDAEFLSKENFLTALDFAKKNGITRLTFVGGEPLIHPHIGDFLKTAKEREFTTVLTTNVDYMFKLHDVMDNIDSINLSNYGKNIEGLEPWMIKHPDITISTIIGPRMEVQNKKDLDALIDKFQEDFHLKFATLEPSTPYAAELIRRYKGFDWLENMGGKKVVLFNEIEGIEYRGTVIKLDYKKIKKDTPSEKSWKCHSNGTISTKW